MVQDGFLGENPFGIDVHVYVNAADEAFKILLVSSPDTDSLMP